MLHTRGLLMEAVTSGADAMVRHMVALHRRHLPQCLRWQRAVEHRLWQDYPDEVQGLIAGALLQGCPRVAVQTSAGAADLDLEAMTHTDPSGTLQMRCVCVRRGGQGGDAGSRLPSAKSQSGWGGLIEPPPPPKLGGGGGSGKVFN